LKVHLSPLQHNSPDAISSIFGPDVLCGLREESVKRCGSSAAILAALIGRLEAGVTPNVAYFPAAVAVSSVIQEERWLTLA